MLSSFSHSSKKRGQSPIRVPSYVERQVNMLSIFESQRYPALLLIFGFVLLVLGIADIEELQKLKLVARNQVAEVPALAGVIMLLVSLALYAIENISFLPSIFGNVQKTANGFRIEIGKTALTTSFGRIELLAEDCPECLIVLPANEFFDDECIEDPASALGAYVTHKFPNRFNEVKAAIKQRLAGLETFTVEKEAGNEAESFGVGKAVLMKTALESDQPIALLSVTTKRAGEGLRSELSYLYKAIGELFAATADARIESICLPLLGAGKGHIAREVALFGLMTAVIERLQKDNGKHVKNMTIVIFQGSDNAPPEVDKSTVKRLLELAAGSMAR